MIPWSQLPIHLVNLLANEPTALAYCHREKCGEVIVLDRYEISRRCEETAEDHTEV